MHEDPSVHVSASEHRPSPLADDIFAFTHIAKKGSLDFELGLFQTKWFDYRMMTPAEATREFIRQYEVVYREVYAAMLDRERSQFVQPMTVEKVESGLVEGVAKAKRYLSSCWRARQVADAMGIPYKNFIRLTMDARLRNWKRNSLPQPSQLYTDYVVEKALSRWEEIQKSRLFLAEHPAYRNENYVGAAHQNDYHEWLLSQASQRQQEADLLADLIRSGALPYEKVMARISDTLKEQVQGKI